MNPLSIYPVWCDLRLLFYCVCLNPQKPELMLHIFHLHFLQKHKKYSLNRAAGVTFVYSLHRLQVARYNIIFFLLMNASAAMIHHNHKTITIPLQTSMPTLRSSTGQHLQVSFHQVSNHGDWTFCSAVPWLGYTPPVERGLGCRKDLDTLYTP